MIRPVEPSRTRSRWLLSGAAVAAAVALTYSVTQGSASTAAPAASGAVASKYIGAKKCKNCHSSDETGNQYGHWESGPHAKAYEVLASDAAKKAAAAAGIDDPQKSDKCMKCHQTAFGVAEGEIKKGFDATAGVQCESCHGPGEAHMKARMMAAAAGGDTPAPIGEGEIINSPPDSTCTGCHNEESPSYKPFCPQVFHQKVRHLNPKKERSAEEKAAMELTDPTKSEACMKCHK